MQQSCLALLATQQVVAVGSMLDPALCFICEQLHFPLCLVLLPWKNHIGLNCPLPLPSLFRGYFLSWLAHRKHSRCVRQIFRSTYFFEQTNRK